MKNFLFSICWLILILNFGCSKKEEKTTILKQKNLETQMIEVYNEAMREFEKGMLFMLEKNLVKQNYYIHNQFGHQEQF